jgi:hypothetical protein
LIPIQSSRYSILSNLPLFSVGVLFVLCVASPRENVSQGRFLVAVALFMLCLGQILLGAEGKFLMECLRAQNDTHENTGAGNIFLSTNDKCEPTPKPPYLSGVVTYEGD